MRFKLQFEYHKIPEWDEHYLHYEIYLEKIEIINRKMKKYKMKRVSSVYYDLSESLDIIHHGEVKTREDDQSLPYVDDDSMKFFFNDSNESNDASDLEVPLFSLSSEVKDVLDVFVRDCKDVSDFYEKETSRITNNFRNFYEKFLNKLNDKKWSLDLEEDMRQHSKDGSGYASSWARQFAEYYSKLSWLDGFGKINVTAIQKILNKFKKIMSSQGNSGIYDKLNKFAHELPLNSSEGCLKGRKMIRGHVANHYFNGKIK